MKKILDTLFRGSVLMAPKWALLIILFGCLAAVGEQSGLDTVVYTSIGALGLLLGIAAIAYSVVEERKEEELRNATPVATPPVIIDEPPFPLPNSMDPLKGPGAV